MYTNYKAKLLKAFPWCLCVCVCVCWEHTYINIFIFCNLLCKHAYSCLVGCRSFWIRFKTPTTSCSFTFILYNLLNVFFLIYSQMQQKWGAKIGTLKIAGSLPVNVVPAAWNHPHIGHSQHLLSDGLAGGVCCCHGDGRGGLIHAQELTWGDPKLTGHQSKRSCKDTAWTETTN